MRIRRKVQKQSGETLIESLVAILISVLSISMLTTCIMASGRINAKNAEADEKYHAELRHAEARLPEDSKDATLKIDYNSVGLPDTIVDITLYGKDDGAFLSYEKKLGGGP